MTPPLTPATINKSLAHLGSLGVVAELTSRQRGRVFSYRKYVEELAAELEPPMRALLRAYGARLEPDPLQVSLSSPWDVVWSTKRRAVVVAMAGAA